VRERERERERKRERERERERRSSIHESRTMAQQCICESFFSSLRCLGGLTDAPQVGKFGPEIQGRASESKPVYIFNENRRDYIACVGVESGTEIKVLPTSHDGGRFDVLDFVSGHVSQGVSENMPVYRRNVVNYLPSIRFTPEQFVAVEEESLLQSRLSGPTHQGGFTWFAVSKVRSSKFRQRHSRSPWETCDCIWCPCGTKPVATKNILFLESAIWQRRKKQGKRPIVTEWV
jgi:hypothetical protein